MDPYEGLTPEERARMEAHIAGGGSWNAWQAGDRPPSPERWGTMSERERAALGLSERGVLGDAWGDYQSRLKAKFGLSGPGSLMRFMANRNGGSPSAASWFDPSPAPIPLTAPLSPMGRGIFSDYIRSARR